ncbi:MAG: hypothetical protein JWR34_3698 [Mycobacterium sp.]|nr:hypothetical protein [Mycobacterium sp.]
MDWGTVPAYFGGFALIATAFTFWRDADERKREQANKIAAWVEVVVDGRSRHVVIKNSSELPCKDIRIAVTQGFKNRTSLTLSKTDWNNTNRYRKPLYLQAIGPEATVTTFTTEELMAIRSLEFTDAAGARWVRRDNGLAKPRRVRFLRLRRQVFNSRRSVGHRWQQLTKRSEAPESEADPDTI